MRPRYDVTSVESENQSFSEHPFVRYINQSRQLSGTDHALDGATRAKLQTLWGLIGLGDMAGTLLQQPGDRTLDYDQDKTKGKGLIPKVALGKPVSPDVWYLKWAGNILRRGHSDYTDEEWITHSLEKMAGYFNEVDPLGRLKSLKQPVQDENVQRTFTYPGSSIYPAKTTGVQGFSGMSPGAIESWVVANWRYTIKEAWYETILKNDSPFYPALPRSKSEPMTKYVPSESPNGAIFRPSSPQKDDAPYTVGPKEPPPDGYVGYLAFPVGAMGIMWQIALATESSINRSFIGVRAPDEETKTLAGNELYPPFDINRKDVAGAKLVDKGYEVTDHTTVEYPAQPFPGLENPSLHGWMRYWIKRDNVEIVPGEFVGLVCRAYPDFCWWYQESSPFVYAGNWLETEFYTSGVVKSVLSPWAYDDYEARSPSMPEQDKTAAEAYYDPHEYAMDFHVGSKLYRIWVKHEELILASSDFKEYEAGDRVGIIKAWRSQDVNDGGYIYSNDKNRPKNFNWMDLQFFNLEGKNTNDADLFITDWQIVPVDFFGATGGA